MKRIALHAALWALASAAGPAGALADEIDDLADKVNLPVRFHGYKPQFHYTQKTFSFETPRGPKKQILRIIMDENRYVALISDDYIQMLAFTPGTAMKTLSLRSGRYHLDNIRGPVIPTGDFIAKRRRYSSRGVVGTPLTDHFRGGGPKISLFRTSESSRQKAISEYEFSVHERYGYVVEGTTTLLIKKPIEEEARKAVTRVFCPNSYVPWPTRWIYDRTAFCPGGTTEIRGWVNNTLAIDRADRVKSSFTWRDKGFIVYLDAKGGWSPCRTRSDNGPDAEMTLDNMQNRFDVTIPFAKELPKDQAERETYTAVHRLFALPPELTEYVRKNMKLINVGSRGVVCRIGDTDDFEDQPVSLAEPIRGLAWTTNPPTVTTEAAHSGKKALMLRGTYQVNDPRLIVEPDIPQVPLRPKATYLLEAWLKVENMTAQERADYLEAYKQMADKLRKANAERVQRGEKAEPIPTYVQPRANAEAYLTAHLYENTPKERTWLVRQQTTAASGYKTAWQKVTLKFTTPDWDPYVYISIVCNSGTAFMDDFTFKRVD